MQTEIEAKFLDIDFEKLRKKLKELGADCINPMRLMRRKNFDFPDKRLEKIGGWVRVRDEGDKITLSYKQLSNRTLHGTKEVSVKVGDFKASCSLLSAIGLVENSYQETKRESWILDGAQVELDKWPWVKPFLEVEAKDEEHIKTTVAKLGLLWKDAYHGSVESVYMAEYNVTEQEIDEIPKILFTEVPGWLSKRRK